MNSIFLPTLERIIVKEYDLYKSNIDYTFVTGVNLFIGGNGVGKTTFLNLIKYGLIGLYKKELDVRTYKGEKRLGRTQYSPNYFKNRMQGDDINANPEIVLTFKIQDITFEVTRGIDEIILKKVVIIENNKEYILNGKIIKQDRYEKLDDKEKTSYLQYKYEDLIRSKSNLTSFNDMIFFVNDILFFGEDRKTILWDHRVQTILSSKYFNDPKLDEAFQDYRRQTKYYDSLSRHKSEDIRAINKVIDKIKEKGSNNKELNTLNHLNDLMNKTVSSNNNLNSIQEERNRTEKELRIVRAKRTKLNNKYQENEKRVSKLEANVYKEVWGEMNPDYELFVANLNHMHSCPMCNQDMEENHVTNILHDETKCILCEQTLERIEKEPEELNKLKEESNNILRKIQIHDQDLISKENHLESLDNEYSELKQKVSNNKMIIRQLEHENVNKNSKDSEVITYSAMLEQIEELDREKNEYQLLSKENLEHANIIMGEIEGNLIKITRELSNIFSDFANDFLGVNCYLTFDNLIQENVKMYTPVINGRERLDPEELSESQRFFIDHSFRMSLLDFFYTRPTFFICETPDSSLDISYEENAAHIFLKYLRTPNTLILTSNLNNSEFLDIIIENADSINYLNLLKLGRSSGIQSRNNKLLQLSEKIEEDINGKNKNP